MDTRTVLRLEGLAVFAAATLSFVLLTDAPWWLFALLVLAPDVSMAGYLAGPRVGAWLYNAAHVYAAPLALAGAGLWASAPLAVAAALVWTAHVGGDRAMGYGLKAESGFRDTHLGPIGRGASPADGERAS